MDVSRLQIAASPLTKGHDAMAHGQLHRIGDLRSERCKLQRVVKCRLIARLRQAGAEKRPEAEELTSIVTLALCKIKRGLQHTLFLRGNADSMKMHSV